VPPETDRLLLFETFSPFGAIASVKLLIDETTGASRGVAFINYVDASCAAKAAAVLNNSMIGNNMVQVMLKNAGP
jgi:RNA recognition motif-containing protein